MQTNLNFLMPGTSYPPASEVLRMKWVRDNILLYEGKLDRVFSWYLTRLGGEDTTTFCTNLNYFKLISSKTADLVCGELPDLSFGDDIEEEQQKEIQHCANIVNSKLRMAVIDYSRFGETALRPYLGSDGEPRVTVYNPTMVIPIASEENRSDIGKYVIAWTTEENKRHYINVQIHEKGKYTHKVFNSIAPTEVTVTADKESVRVLQYAIGSEVKSEEVNTGLTDFAVYHIANEPTSDNPHGRSDYEMFSSLIAELEVRFAQIARILDKHANPNMASPIENIEFDPVTGKHTGLKTGGKVWEIVEGKPAPHYIVWDGQLQAAYKHIEELQGQLDRLTEMGAVVSDNDDGGGTQGFEALQVKMTNARLKARRISEALDKPYKDLIKAVYLLKYKKELTVDLNVTWNDGLPNDEMRDAMIAQLEMSTKLKPPSMIRKERYNMSKAQSDNAQAELDALAPNEVIEPVFGE